MGNEKYVNYYVEVLTSTMTDCVIRNVSMQANAKITDDVIKEQSDKINKLTEALITSEENLKKQIEQQSLKESEVVANLKNQLTNSSSEIDRLKKQIEELNTKYRDYYSIKNQVSHVDTFKNELIKARNEKDSIRGDLERRIQELISENRSKIDELNTVKQNEINNLNSTKQNQINELNLEKQNQINDLTKKHEQNVGELNKKIEELNSKIDYLQLPPAKRKKIDELNKESSSTIITNLEEDKNLVGDGGTF
jgi:DNA repair exonuclease SbcCD ATPase subunit